MGEPATPPEGLSPRDAHRIALAARASALWHRSFLASLPAGGTATVFLVGSLWLPETRSLASLLGLPLMGLSAFCLSRAWRASNRCLDTVLRLGPPGIHALQEDLRKAKEAGDRRAESSASDRLVAEALSLAEASLSWDAAD